ncbi:Phosphoserine phosphatase RsbU [Lacunisphaera limnophila]|uniref:Phosphoserine phosphatase RsbU n=1 Tax=Lacunisphaera limnophila TaxID=1838286 RepID=A0A1D8AYC9_9BACT|nr:GAF domain-containing SpoIIE family protein phosphatase [Lacunisphaera limnophila]AOS45877.1 Phosphoserine phosphatase RsbU [Lacunisphaera limnophila]
MSLFLLGALLSAAIVYAFYWRAQREAATLQEENEILREEREIVIDYMHTMVDAVGERLPRDELFQRIVHASILSTGALSACIFEKGADNQMRGVAVEGLFPPHRPIPDTQRMKLGTRAKFIEQVLKSEVFPVGEGLVGRVAATGRGELIARAEADPRMVRHDDEALAVRSVIAAPILVRKRLIGVLCVCNPADGLPFTESDYSLVEALAEQAGLAVHNADFLALQVDKQRLDLDLSLASEIQQMLLPRRMPVVAGLDLDARYIAAQKVSGDLYDVFELGEGRLGLAVADVAGKGVSASLLMAICRTALRQIAPGHHSPAKVLAELNRTLSGDMKEGAYITMLYAVVDVPGNRLMVARAGHERALLSRHQSGANSFVSEYLASEGMPLGLVDADLFDTVIEDQTVDFLPGSTLLLYTDGLTEAPNADDKEFGGARLADTMRTAHQGTARQINDAVFHAVQTFTGSTGLRDDYTLLTVKRL